MPTPVKASDFLNDNVEGVWINDDNQGFISENTSRPMTNAERDSFEKNKAMIKDRWESWKRDNPTWHTIGSLTPFVGTYFNYKDFEADPNLENAIWLTISALGDATPFIPAFRAGKLFKGIQLAKDLKRNPAYLAAKGADVADKGKTLGEAIGGPAGRYVESSEIDSTRTQTARMPVVVSADDVRNAIRMAVPKS